ncbi:MAG TPA: hypothetical protein VFL14_08320 [Xanthomonadales bacterium]|nr:hypothetical protein [Xanthomonadales bacterium]
MDGAIAHGRVDERRANGERDGRRAMVVRAGERVKARARSGANVVADVVRRARRTRRDGAGRIVVGPLCCAPWLAEQSPAGQAVIRD